MRRGMSSASSVEHAPDALEDEVAEHRVPVGSPVVQLRVQIGDALNSLACELGAIVEELGLVAGEKRQRLAPIR